MIELQSLGPEYYEQYKQKYQEALAELNRAKEVYEQSGKCYDLAYIDVCKKNLAEAKSDYERCRKPASLQTPISQENSHTTSSEKKVSDTAAFCYIFVGIVLYGFFLYWMSTWIDFPQGVAWYVLFWAPAYCLMNVKDHKRNVFINIATVISVAMVAAPAALLIVYVIGYIWYFVCCGFLVVEAAESFGDYVVYGLTSLVLLGLVGGFIAIIFGWKPK